MPRKATLADRVSRIPVVGWLAPEVQDTDSDVSEDNQQSKDNVPSQAVPVGTRPSPSVASYVSPSNFSSTGSSNVDPATRAKVEEIAARADQVSYRRFSEQRTNMMRVFPDNPDAAYKAALAASGPVVEIVKGIDVILRDLGKFESDFKLAVPARIAAKVGERQDRVTSIENDLSSKKNRSASLQAELSQIQVEMAKLIEAQQIERSAMAQDEKTIREDESRVTTAITSVTSYYRSERQKIEEQGRGL